MSPGNPWKPITLETRTMPPNTNDSNPPPASSSNMLKAGMDQLRAEFGGFLSTETEAERRAMPALQARFVPALRSETPPPSASPDTSPATTTTTKPSRTAEEQDILDAIAQDRGREFAEQNAEAILEQARMIGNL